jgi:Arc/MetJ-type ribon-helix-helix transcriptional regulator
MRQVYSGADLVREALAAARTLQEREAARTAADQAADEVAALLLRAESMPIDSYPVTVARQRVIDELHAVAANTWPPPPAFFSGFERGLYERELETARKLAADVVRQSLRPPPQ